MDIVRGELGGEDKAGTLKREPAPEEEKRHLEAGRCSCYGA